MSDLLLHLLTDLDIRPVLVDVGSSGEGPASWQRIASASTYVGFDPDSREPELINGGSFKETRVVRKAVTFEAAEEITFHLTAEPHCSSTLLPDAEALSSYLFAPRFSVVETTLVPAVTIDHALDAAGLDGPDWLKIDSQGTDLRIFTGISDARRDALVAVDVEPGLIDAYQGEDLFVATHAHLKAQGFWPSRFLVRGAARMSRAAMSGLSGRGIDAAVLDESLRESPGWIEARYLSGLPRVRAHGGSRMLVMLWVSAMLDDQPGFAYEVAQDAPSAGVPSEAAALMREAAIKRMQRALRLRRARRIAALPRRVVRRARRELGAT